MQLHWHPPQCGRRHLAGARQEPLAVSITCFNSPAFFALTALLVPCSLSEPTSVLAAIFRTALASTLAIQLTLEARCAHLVGVAVFHEAWPQESTSRAFFMDTQGVLRWLDLKTGATSLLGVETLQADGEQGWQAVELHY